MKMVLALKANKNCDNRSKQFIFLRRRKDKLLQEDQNSIKLGMSKAIPYTIQQQFQLSCV